MIYLRWSFGDGAGKVAGLGFAVQGSGLKMRCTGFTVVNPRFGIGWYLITAEQEQEQLWVTVKPWSR